MEAGGVDQDAAADRGRLVAADIEFEPVRPDPAAQHRRAERDKGAGFLGLALVGEHQRVAVDDAGRGRQQRRDAVQLGFEALRLGGGQPFEIGDAVGAGRRLDLLDAGDFGLLGRDDQLAEPRVRHAALGAIGVEALAPGDAGHGLEAAGRVVEAAMDDLAVARGGLEADRIGAFEDDDLVPGQCQRARRRQPDDPGADHHRFDLVHRCAPLATPHLTGL